MLAIFPSEEPEGPIRSRLCRMAPPGTRSEITTAAWSTSLAPRRINTVRGPSRSGEPLAGFADGASIRNQVAHGYNNEPEQEHTETGPGPTSRIFAHLGHNSHRPHPISALGATG